MTITSDDPRLIGFDNHTRPTLLWTWLTARSIHFGRGWRQVQAPWV